ncbi:MAG TPA: protoporphyrinogen oxidase [Limnochordales bacterium]
MPAGVDGRLSGRPAAPGTGAAGAAGAPLRVAIVGGGISGLGVAYYLAREARQGGLCLECHLFEAERQPGGKLRTARLTWEAGRGEALVELGAESLVSYKPRPLQLARELGLEDQLVSPAGPLGTLIFRRGRLRRLPAGLMGLVPTSLGEWVRTDLVSWPGKLRMALEWLVPPRRDGADESLACFVRRRLGQEAVEALAQPLLAGIHGGDAERLSVLAVFPRLREQETRYGSLLRAMLAARGAGSGAAGRAPGGSGGTSAGPGFWSLRGGLGQLAAALKRACGPTVQVHTGCRVDELAPLGPEGGFWLRAGGRPWQADAVVLAVPAWEAARLVAPWDPVLARGLGAIRYASVAVAALVYPAAAVPRQSPVWRSSGVLVAPGQDPPGLCVSACTWFSTKWPHSVRGPWVVVRASVGRDGQEEALQKNDAELLQAVQEDLSRLAGLAGPAAAARLQRWPLSLPQYEVGHRERVRALEERCGLHPGLFLAGAAWNGAGVADCLERAEQVASRLAAFLGQQAPARNSVSREGSPLARSCAG